MTTTPDQNSQSTTSSTPSTTQDPTTILTGEVPQQEGQQQQQQSAGDKLFDGDTQNKKPDTKPDAKPEPTAEEKAKAEADQKAADDYRAKFKDETAEQKAERLKNETPEDKALRERIEKEDADAKKKADEEAEKRKEWEGAPEKYEPFSISDDLKDKVNVDPDLLSKFEETARKYNLNQKGAQALIDIQLEAQRKMFEAHVNQKKQWAETISKDRDFGNEHFDQTKLDGNTFISTFGDSEVKKMLVDWGIGAHPAFVKMFARAGRAMRDDVMLNKGQGGAENLSAAEVLYGKD